VLNKISTRRAQTTIGMVLLLAAGFACMLDGLHELVLYRVGLVMGLLGACGIVACRSVVASWMIDDARRSAYDTGFVAGCKATMRAELSDRPGGPLTLLRTPQELLQQGDFGSGTDGVSRN
jgi:hypothetical protein